MTYRALQSPKFETQLLQPIPSEGSQQLQSEDFGASYKLREMCLNLGHELKGLRYHLRASAATHNSSQMLLQLYPSPGNAFQA